MTPGEEAILRWATLARTARGECTLVSMVNHPALPQDSTAPGGGPASAQSPPNREDRAEERRFAEYVLRAEARAVTGLVDRLGEGFHSAVGLIVRCADSGGTVLVSGLGKSGLIGAKISATLKSLGIPSHFVHPTEAAHGDLGSFRVQDLCMALSYSGETEEVVALAGILRQDGIPVIGICRGDGGSGLERASTVCLSVGPVEETESISPAPACSTTAMLALGDALALASSRRRRFTADDFAKRHPGGTLGGLLRPVVDALRFTVGRNLIPVRDDLSVREALATSSSGGRKPGAMLLISAESGKLTGIFTDGDLHRLIVRSEDELGRPIGEVMTRTARTLPDSALIRDAVRLVREQRCDEIPVVDAEGKPVGILDVQDLVAMKVVSG